MKIFTLRFVLILLSLTAMRAAACDICGCYTPCAMAEHRLRTPILNPEERSPGLGLYGALAEQFTHFGTVQVDGNKVANPTGQYLDSSITQFVVGYGFNDRFSLQANIPFIYRSFKRPEGFAIDRGTESGVGDVSLLGSFILFRKNALYENASTGSGDGRKAVASVRGGPQLSMVVNLIGGVKLPTGDASRIKEEFNEIDVEGAPPSGIHGHDLALGSGSVDGIIGASAFVNYRRWFFDAAIRYTIRSEGLYHYRYANDLTWEAGPGFLLIDTDRARVGLEFQVSGEYKGTDTFQGASAADTGMTAVYVGPRFIAAIGERVSGEIGADLPLLLDNTSLQTVPDYKIRAAITIRF